MSDTPGIGRIRLLLALGPEVESISRRDALILAESIATLTRDLSATTERAERAAGEYDAGHEAGMRGDVLGHEGEWRRRGAEHGYAVYCQRIAEGRARSAEARLAAVRQLLWRWLAWHGDRDNLYDVDEIAAETRALLTDGDTPGEEP